MEQSSSPRRPLPKQRYFIGDILTRVDGSTFMVEEVNRTPHYETFKGSDGVWRYDRDHPSENGRPTGTQTFPPHPAHLLKGHPLNNPREVMEALSNMPKFRSVWRCREGVVTLDTRKSIEAVCRILDHLFDQEDIL